MLNYSYLCHHVHELLRPFNRITSSDSARERQRNPDATLVNSYIILTFNRKETWISIQVMRRLVWTRQHAHFPGFKIQRLNVVIVFTV